jgi:hypothetical protein
MFLKFSAGSDLSLLYERLRAFKYGNTPALDKNLPSLMMFRLKFSVTTNRNFCKWMVSLIWLLFSSMVLHEKGNTSSAGSQQ